MAKADGPALFDLLGEEPTRAPSSTRRGGTSAGRGQPQRARADGGSAENRDAERPVVLRTQPQPDRGGAARTGQGGAHRPPLIEFDDDRIRVTLTTVRSAVLVFAVLIAMLAAFEIGRSRGERDGFAEGFDSGKASYTAGALSEIEAARNAPPATELIGSLLVDSATPNPAAADSRYGADSDDQPRRHDVTWITGHTYVVAQGFQAGRDADAADAKAFLASRGLETELIRFASGAMQLVTVEGYNRDDPTQRNLADRLLEKVHAAGEAYFASGGGYRLDGYFATFTGDRW